RVRRELLKLFLPELLVHQQADDLWIPPEAPAVRVIGRQIYPPRILDEQQKLEPDGPLNGVDCMAIAVDVRNDPTARFVLDVEIAPLATRELVQHVLPGAVGGDRHRVAKQYSAGVGRQVRVLLGGERTSGVWG